MRNYLALLGWGSGDDETVLSTEELVERFTLEHVSRNPARFDEVKLGWLNGVYIRSLPPAELARRWARSSSTAVTLGTGRWRFEHAVEISQEKIHTLADFWPLAGPLLDGLADDERRASAGSMMMGELRSPTSATRLRPPSASTRRPWARRLPRSLSAAR